MLKSAKLKGECSLIDKKSFAHKNAEFVHRYSLLIILVIAIITALVLPLASQLRVKANFLDLLPKNLPSVVQLNDLTDQVGGSSYLVAVIESEDESTANYVAKQYAEKIAEYPQVDYVDNRTSLPAFEKRKLLFLKLDSIKKLDKEIDDLVGYHRRKNNPFFVDLLNEEEPTLDISSLELEEKVYRIGSFEGQSEGEYLRVVLIKPKHAVSDFVESEKLFTASEKIVTEIRKEASKSFDFGLTGSYRTRYDEYFTIMRDLSVTGILTIILVTILMFLFFNTKRSIFLTYLTLGVGILWTCAFAQFAVGYLNLITTFLLCILFGMGIDFAIHFLVRFGEARSEGNDNYEALKQTYASIGEPAVTSAVTTSIAFFSLTLSEFYGFKHFGIIAGVGIIFCFLVIFYGLPSLIFVTEKMKKTKWKPSFNFFTWNDISKRAIVFILCVGTVITLISIFLLPKTQFEYDFSQLQEKNSKSIELAGRIGDHFGVVLNPVAIVTPNRERAAEITKMINQYIKEHADTSFDFAASIWTHVPKEQNEKIDYLKKMNVKFERRERMISKLDPKVREDIHKLTEQLMPTVFGIEDLPEGITKQYEGEKREVSVVYVYPKSSLLDGRVAKKFSRELSSLNLPKDVQLAGEPMIYADILFILERDTPRALLLCLGLVLILLFFHFRKLGDILWVLAPIFLGFVWMIGLSSLFKVKLNYLNVTILPSILGVGIDNGIHIFHRYKKEKKKTLKEILKRTGKAVVMSSLTTMAAFLSVHFAYHRGMSSLGDLGFLGFSCCLVTSVFFVPAMIEFFEKKYWKKKTV